MMATHRVFHWKHGWIPLDHEASKSPSAGIRSRQDVAKALIGLPSIPKPHEKQDAARQVKAAAHKHGATDLLPPSLKSSHGLPADTVLDLRGGSADKHLVTDATGTHFSPERTALHDKIIDKIVGGHKKQKNPAFVMLGGGPASGKTKAAQTAEAEFTDAVKIDPDAIKAMLPEYAQMTPEQAAAFVHEESSYLAKRAMDAALESRAHIVLDAVGDNSIDSVRGKIGKARAAGYTAHGRYVTVPTEVAQARAHARGIKSGRVVHPEVIEKLHAGVSGVFPQVMHDFDSAALHDNTTEWKSVLTKQRGKAETIHDAAAWRAFVQKAKKA